MARAYIVRSRSDLGAGAVQIVDLQPNTSQASATLQPIGQSGYLPPAHQSDTAATVSPGAGGGSSVDSDGALNGLAAYLLDNVEDAGAGTPAITAAVANASAAFLYSNYIEENAAAAGSDITATEINAALTANGTANATGGTGIATGNSTGSVEEVLKILSGEVYTLPDASEVTDAAGAFVTTPAGAFDSDASTDRGVREIYNTGSLQISCGAGHLSVLSDDNAFSYGGSAGAACRVYAADGSYLGS